jgi:lipopolysaccharide export system protein LptA
MRTLILVMSTLATIGVLFAVYQFFTAAPPVEARQQPAVAQTLDQAAELPTASASGEPNFRFGAPMTLQPGRRVVVRDYDPQTGQGRFVLEVASWAPVPDSTEEWDLESPRIALRTPNGQAIDVTAEHGRIELRRGDRERLAPRRGRLWGNIKINLDRLSETERQALPVEQREAPPGEERLVHIEAEDVDFDLEYARVASVGPIRVRSAEATVAVTGLSLRYNDQDSTIEHMEIPKGGTIELTGRGNMFRVAVPGTSSALDRNDEIASKAVVREAAPAPAPDRPSSPPDDIPIFEPDEPKTPKPHPVVTYRASFHDRVQVEQRDGRAQLTGRLTADLLELLFDFGQTQREAVSRGQPSSPTVEAAAAPAVAQSKTSPVEDSGEKTLVTWTGPLKLDFVPEAQDPDPASKGRRAHAIATGEIVRVWDLQGEALCGRLEYHDETKFVALAPHTADGMISIRSSENGEMEGRTARFEGQARTGTIVGPGRLLDTRGRIAFAEQRPSDSAATPTSAGTEIRFADRLDIELASVTRPKKDAATGAVREATDDYLKKAVFIGAVQVMQKDDTLSAQRIEAEFAAPQEGQSPGDTIERLYAKGNVQLTHGEDRIQSDELEVEMGADASGRFAPRRAVARGNAVAQQGQRRISAANQMTVDLVRIERPTEPLPTMEQAREMARQRGVDPDSVDWEKLRARQEQRRPYDLGLARLQAVGEIMVTDPGQSLEVIGDRIDCRFADGRTLQSAFIVGPESGHATVKMEDVAIMGRTIDLDTTRPYAHVPGAGWLTFVTQQDLDGKQLDKPTPVVVSWSRDMAYRGSGTPDTASRTATATFLGDVHAVSENSTFDAAEMSIDFVDAAKPATVTERAQRGRASTAASPLGGTDATGWAALTPLVARLTTRQHDVQRADAPRRERTSPVERFAHAAADGGVALALHLHPAAGAAGMVLTPLISNLTAPSRPAQRSNRLQIEDVASKEPVYVLASDNVVAVTMNLNTQTGNIDTRGRIAGNRLAIDLRSKVMKIEGAGNLLIEDYQLSQPDKSAGDQTRTPFGGVGAEGPSQTYVAWSGSMSYDYANYGASFERDVTLIHRSGSKIVLGEKIFAVDKATAASFTKGRDALMNADQMIVAFTRPAERGRTQGIGRMSGADFRQFQAEGEVYFTDSGVTVTANRVSYHRQQNTLWIYGKENQDAEIIDQRRGYQILNSREIRWNRTTGRIDIEGPSRFIGN